MLTRDDILGFRLLALSAKLIGGLAVDRVSTVCETMPLGGTFFHWPEGELTPSTVLAWEIEPSVEAPFVVPGGGELDDQAVTGAGRLLAHLIYEVGNLREQCVADCCNSLAPHARTALFGVNLVTRHDIRDWARYWKHGDNGRGGRQGGVGP